MIFINPSDHDFRRFKNRADFCELLKNSNNSKPSVEEGAETALLENAHKALRERQGLRSTFPPSLFRDSGWEVLLTTFVAQLEGRQLCVKQLHSVIDESNTALLRRLTELEAEGLTVRIRDATDARRSLVRLTAKATTSMARYLAQYSAADG